jgi:hypothetical protein
LSIVAYINKKPRKQISSRLGSALPDEGIKTRSPNWQHAKPEASSLWMSPFDLCDESSSAFLTPYVLV